MAQRRIWILFRARLSMARRAGWAIPALFFHGALSAVLALLVRDFLPPFPYALLALSASAGFLALPLLSDLGSILRRDEGGDWIAALPARDLERALARTLHLCVLLLALDLALLVPFAVLAPAELGLPGRLALPVVGFGLSVVLASGLLWAQRLLLQRFERALVVLQTVLVLGVVVGLLRLLGHLPALARLDPGTTAWLRFFPPAWFAAPVATSGGGWMLPACLSLASGMALVFVPVPPVSSSVRHSRLAAVWLLPLRHWVAERWVRADERGAFDLVFDGLPREREFTLRTLPMLGIPLAFFWIGALEARGDGGPGSADLLALLLFTVGVYLPVLLTHVPLSESAQASWILRTAPKPEGAILAGAVKALFLRFLLPLHLLLAGLAILVGAGGLLLRLWLPSLFLALCLLWLLYPACVRGLPLSTPPEELQADIDWVAKVSGLALALTLAAVLANRFVTWPLGLLLSAGLVWGGTRLEQGLRRRLG